MLKRSLYGERRELRRFAFIVIFLAIMKMCVFDLRMLKKEIFCGGSQALYEWGCNRHVFTTLDTMGVIVSLLAAFIIFQLYKMFYAAPPKRHVSPEKAHVRFWANLSLGMNVMMVLWQLAPWVGFLTIGEIPGIFITLPWQVLAIMNLLLLIVAFWRAEDCSWEYNLKDKARTVHMNKPWTAKDTLWMCVFIYLITLTLSYVAYDVLN